MAATIMDTLPEHWKYISEGGATIVFSYIGPLHRTFDGTVLRLRKTLLNASNTVSSTVEPIRDESDDSSIEFQQKCMERLIPSEHLPRLESIGVDHMWLQRLAILHDTHRPMDRRDRDRIDFTRSKGVLATDLVGGDWLAVEIKPKWGFLPSATHLSEITRTIKTQMCRFCMHSRVKAESGEKATLGYCPLGLFSGQETQIRSTVRALWDAWVESNGEINNLKIFSRGTRVPPSKMEMILANGTAYFSPEQLREAFICAILPLLLNTPILRILSTLQRTLDALDIEGLSKLLCSNRSYPMIRSNPTTEEWTQFLDRYLSSENDGLDHTDPLPENARYYALAYLLSATFKDCSIFIRLNLLGSARPFPDWGMPEQVTVIDLDPKHMDRLHKWEKQDQEIVGAILRADISHRKLCIDRLIQLNL